MNRKDLINAYWAGIETTMNGYSAAIQRLLNMLTDEQLESIVDEGGEEDVDDERRFG